MKFIKKLSTNYTNYGNTITSVFYPYNIIDLKNIIKFCKKSNLKMIPVGSKLSWYDTILNTQNIILDLKKFKKKFSLKEDNTLVLTPNFTIKEVVKKLENYGLSLISTPGAMNASIGGCVGNDVHGKDSFRYGNFCENLIYVKIMTPDGKIITVRKKNKNLFKSVCGGLGLIGIIIEIRLKLKKVDKFYKKETIKCENYKDLIRNIYKNNKEYENIFGWMDLYSSNKSLGRGVLFKIKKNNEKKTKDNFSLKLLNFLIDKIRSQIFSLAIKLHLVRYINFIYYNFIVKDKVEIINNKSFMYPLDDLNFDIKKLIQPYYFCEIQIIIEKRDLPNKMINFIKYTQKLKLKSFIAGVKIHKKSSNYLSFAGEGISLNLNHVFDNKNKEKILHKMNLLHNYCIKNNFKIYLGKDFFINKKQILKIYKNSKKFFNAKKKLDPNNLIISDFYKRINL